MAPRRTFLEAVVPVLEPEQVEELAQMINERRDAYREEHCKRDGSGPGHRSPAAAAIARGGPGKKGGQACRARRGARGPDGRARRGFAARREEPRRVPDEGALLNPKQVATMTETLVADRRGAEGCVSGVEARKNDFDRVDA
ncbi:MAG: hypothetical protein R3B81_04665 [bacterium]